MRVTPQTCRRSKVTDYQRPERYCADPDAERPAISLCDDYDHEPGVPARSQESEDLGFRRSEHHRSGNGCRSGRGIGERRQPRGRRRWQHLHRRGFPRRRGRRHLVAEGFEQRRRPDRSGEGLGRWASNGTVGSEFTGLYFDRFDKRRAWVDIQHPDSGNDRTIEIRIPKH